MKIYKSLAAIAISIGLIQTTYSSPWPTAVPDYVTAQSGQRTYIRALANDRGENLSLDEVNARTVGLGTVKMNAYRNALYYTSARGFTGNDSFWYAIKDSRGRTNSTQVFVNVIPAAPKKTNRAKTRVRNSTKNKAIASPSNLNNTRSNNYSGWPTANIDVVTTTKNTAIAISVLDNDSGDRLRLTEVNEWSVNGGRAFIRGNRVEYHPKANYVGQDSFWYNFTDAKGRTNSAEVKLTITDSSVSTGYTPTAATKQESNTDTGTSTSPDAIHIPMHVGFLKSQRFVWGEPKGTHSMKVTQAAPTGSAQITVGGGFKLLNDQLISYRSTNGDYYTVAIKQIQGDTITLKSALPAPLAEGSDIWNFYHDGAHPNTIGYRSLADFVLRNNDVAALNSGKHVMLGDSWFTRSGITERLAEKLSNAEFIKAGVGGNTAAEMIKRFDRDVASRKPDVVWLIAGTNDYYRDVSVATYTANMKILITKINDIGAKAMVFDSSVAPLMSGSDRLTEKSSQYAQALTNLLKR